MDYHFELEGLLGQYFASSGTRMIDGNFSPLGTGYDEPSHHAKAASASLRSATSTITIGTGGAGLLFDSSARSRLLKRFRIGLIHHSVG
jgi:hypothetical protein